MVGCHVHHPCKWHILRHPWKCCSAPPLPTRVFVVANGGARVTTPRGVVRGLMLGARRHNNSGGWWRSVAGRPRGDVSCPLAVGGLMAWLEVGRVVVVVRRNPPPGLIGWCARAAIVVVSSARLDSLVGCCAVQALWLILIFSAVPPWLRALLIRSRPPSSCRGDGQLATTRR